MTNQQPEIVHREPQPYASIGGTVTMDQVGAIADRFPEVFAAAARHGRAPSGAPFLRYRVIDMDRELQIEACVPIDAPLPADDGVSTDALPGGRYAVATHRGHFDGLMDATARLRAPVFRHRRASQPAHGLLQLSHRPVRRRS